MPSTAIPKSLALLALVLVSFAAGCVMRQRGPDFKRFSREHRFEVKPAMHAIGMLELTVKSGSVSEVYTALGSENFTAHVEVRLTNQGSQPIAFQAGSMGAISADGPERTAVYFSDVEVPPKGQKDLQINIPAGTSRLRPPVALVYRDVRMDL